MRARAGTRSRPSGPSGSTGAARPGAADSTSSDASAVSQARTQRRMPALRRAGAPLLGTEVDLRHLLDRSLVLDRKLRLLLVAERLGGQVLRKLPDVHVVVLHRLDVPIAGDRDAVFRAFELRPQILEALVGLQVRIVLAGHQQP